MRLGVAVRVALRDTRSTLLTSELESPALLRPKVGPYGTKSGLALGPGTKKKVPTDPASPIELDDSESDVNVAAPAS